MNTDSKEASNKIITIPNILTVFRLLLIPVMVWCYCIKGEYLWTMAVIMLSGFTDVTDGYIARKYKLITNFGKFMDPLADKLLVAAALICFIELGRMPAWIVLIIISREFIISGFRLVAAEGGKVIAAGYWGKVKTAVTMVTIIFMIPNFGLMFPATHAVYIIEQIMVYASLALTVISLVDYLMKNKEVLGGEM